MKTEREEATAVELDAALVADVLDDVDADYEFFFGLFDDEPQSDDNVNGDTTTDSDASDRTTSNLVRSSRSNRRRQRWHQATPDKTDLAIVIRMQVPSSVEGRTASETLALAWNDIAKSQKCQRLAAEKENAALRELLKTQTRAAQRIFKLMQKAGTLATNAMASIGASQSYLGPAMPLDQINDELDLLALEADVVLASGAFASQQLEFREINFRRVDTETGDSIQLELDTAWVLPFPVEEVADAALQQLARTTPKEKIYSVHDVHNDAELIVTHAVAGPKDDDDGKSAVIHTQIATRRLPTASDGSVVLVMKTYGRFITTGGTAWVGSSNGEGYIRVTSVSTATTPLSRIEFCRRTRAHPPADANLSPAERAQWMDAAVNGPMRGSSQRVDKVVQALENLLLTPSGKET